MFKRPSKDRLYVCTVDVARGTNKDYSVFIIFDVTKTGDKINYEVVAIVTGKHKDDLLMVS